MTPSALADVLAVLVVANVVGNLRVPAPWYVPANLVVTTVVVALARPAGASAGELGLAMPGAHGLGTAVAVSLGVALVVLAVAVVPRTRPLCADQRMAGVGGAGAAYRAVVRIPLGTVVLEEVAFRGVLLALLARLAPLAWAVAGSSMLFGLWHVLPTMAALDANGIARPGAARRLAVVGAVGATALAGAALCWLRTSTGSLLGAALPHAAANSTSTAAAFFALRSRRGAGATDCRDAFLG